MIQQITERILKGGEITPDEAYELTDAMEADATGEVRRSVYEAAARVTGHFGKPVFQSCSIVNARSGRCPENCKWCAQSAHYKTKCDVYDLISPEECMHAATLNAQAGIKRFSIVTSGKAAHGQAMGRICSMLRDVKEKTGIHTCASLGLIGNEEMEMLRDHGVERYHCNLETAPSHFSTLCTTHTMEDKLHTIEAAHKAGLEVCSGGIIGMGETRRQRTEFALALRLARPVSIPLNILCPIPGTPLQDAAPLSEQEILDTVAIFRLVHPRVELRFAGGRHNLTREGQLKAMRLGINGGITGDLLTTTGSTVSSDRSLAEDAGLEF